MFLEMASIKRRRFNSGAPLIDPLTLFTGGFTGVLIDYSASEMYSDAGVTPAVDGGPVHSIENRVNGGLISQTSGVAQGLKSAAGIVMDGVNDFYDTGTIASVGTIVCCIDVHASAAANARLWGGSSSSSAGFRNQSHHLDGSFLLSRTHSGGALPIGGDPRGQRVHTASIRATGAGNIFSYVDGALVDESITTGQSGDRSRYLMAFNSNLVATNFLRGTIRGWLFINRVLTIGEIQSVRDYWAD